MMLSIDDLLIMSQEYHSKQFHGFLKAETHVVVVSLGLGESTQTDLESAYAAREPVLFEGRAMLIENLEFESDVIDGQRIIVAERARVTLKPTNRGV